MHTDPAKVHPLDHRGRHFTVRGPLNVGRSEQGRPVVVQAGSSEAGMALAARYAEAVFTAQRSIEEGRAFRNGLRARTAAAGRSPDEIKILPGIVPIIADTVAEAERIERELDDLLVTDHGAAQLAGLLGVPVDSLDLDAPLPERIRPAEEIQGNRTRYELIVDLGRRENLTIRQILSKLGGGRGHRTIAGTPEQIADDIAQWYRAGAADGFNVMPQVLPSGLERFVGDVVPLLQQRGLFRSDYTGSTLREHYGLPVPSGASAGRADVRKSG